MSSIKLVYTGLRLSADKDIIHRFVCLKTNDVRYFKKVKSVFVGDVYEATKKGSKVLIAEYPKEVGRESKKFYSIWGFLK